MKNCLRWKTDSDNWECLDYWNCTISDGDVCGIESVCFVDFNEEVFAFSHFAPQGKKYRIHVLVMVIWLLEVLIEIVDFLDH